MWSLSNTFIAITLLLAAACAHILPWRYSKLQKKGRVPKILNVLALIFAGLGIFLLGGAVFTGVTLKGTAGLRLVQPENPFFWVSLLFFGFSLRSLRFRFPRTSFLTPAIGIFTLAVFFFAFGNIWLYAANHDMIPNHKTELKMERVIQPGEKVAKQEKGPLEALKDIF